MASRTRPAARAHVGAACFKRSGLEAASDSAKGVSSRMGSRGSSWFRAIAGVAAVAVQHWREPAGSAGAVQFLIPPPDNMLFGGPAAGGTGTATQLAISPDGRSIVFVATNGHGGYQLWLRPLDAVTARPLEGTDAAAFPFWSPD